MVAVPIEVFIRSYGLFWSADEVNWFPRSDPESGPFELLGRIGTKRGSLWVCDFRYQKGIYVLYDDYGPYYVGLTRRQTLGTRLRAHRNPRSRHARNWDRFSWFGFRDVSDDCYDDGTSVLGDLPTQLLADARSSMRDTETLLMRALGTHHRGNETKTRFVGADEWTQITKLEVESYLDRL